MVLTCKIGLSCDTHRVAWVKKGMGDPYVYIDSDGREFKDRLAGESTEKSTGIPPAW